MKRLISVITALSLFAGCAPPQAKITKNADLEGKVVATVSSTHDPAMVKIMLEDNTGVKFKEMLFFETFAASVAALKSGQVDAVFNSAMTISFYASTDDALAVIPASLPEGTTAHMALRTSDAELIEKVNAALITMRDDGTLARLEQEYITNLTPDMQLQGRDMPRFEGAPTLNVGVAGDVPPLDYVAADGKPAGYNAELLNVMAELLQMNIEISVTPTESKFPALAAERIDVFFLEVQNAEIEVMTANLEQNSNITLSEPYHIFTGVGSLVLK